MSDPLWEEYQAYYRTRAERYAENPRYANTYRAEKNLSDLVQSCEEPQDFKDRLGNLNELCANALIKDECLMEKSHFEKHQEHIRIQSAVTILEKVDDFTQVMDLITMVTNVIQQNGIAVSLDEANRQFIYDWDYIDRAEIYAKAEVPDKYKSDMQESAAQMRRAIAESVRNLTADLQHWHQGWKINPEVNMEYRHRRLLPFTDDQIREQLAKFNAIINT